MKPIRRAFIVGGAITPFIGKSHPDFVWKGHPDFGKRDNPTLEDYVARATLDAIADAGATPDQVQKGYIGNFAGELFSGQGHLGAMVVRADERLEGKPFARIEGACASGGLAVLGCIESIQAGYDITLAVGAEVQTTVSARQGADFLARASHYATERALDEFTFPCMFARRARYCKEATGLTDEEIGLVTVKAYDNANRNPLAHMKAVRMDEATVASSPNFLANEDFKAHLRISDCSQVSDGGAAMVIVSEEGLRRLGKTPDDAIEITSWGQATSPLGRVRDFTRLDNTKRAADEAYADAGIGAGDVQIAEVHDCFAVTELLMYEALGFAAYGQGGALMRSGATRLDGAIPVNTGGGLIAFGHPVGATGVKQVWEIARQMRGACGDYQVRNPIRYGITANMGGDDRSTVCMVLRNPSV